VRVDDGDVTLEGRVEHRAARRLAEEIASAVPGVRDVFNRLISAERCPA
jgi:osmotically-inducible protein OsmY